MSEISIESDELFCEECPHCIEGAYCSCFDIEIKDKDFKCYWD